MDGAVWITSNLTGLLSGSRNQRIRKRTWSRSISGSHILVVVVRLLIFRFFKFSEKRKCFYFSNIMNVLLWMCVCACMCVCMGAYVRACMCVKICCGVRIVKTSEIISPPSFLNSTHSLFLWLSVFFIAFRTLLMNKSLCHTHLPSRSPRPLCFSSLLSLPLSNARKTSKDILCMLGFSYVFLTQKQRS